MAQPSYRRHRFPASIIQHAIWLYLYADRIDGSIGTPSAERAEGCAPASTQEGMRPMPGHLIRSMPDGRGGSWKKCLRRSAAASWALDDQARHVSTHGSASAAKGVRASEYVCAMRDRRRRHFLKRRQAR